MSIARQRKSTRRARPAVSAVRSCVPGFNATVARPNRVVVSGLDREGVQHTVEGTGLLARCFQHEMDHLDGRLFVDHLRGLQKDLILRKIKKLARAGKW